MGGKQSSSQKTKLLLPSKTTATEMTAGRKPKSVMEERRERRRTRRRSVEDSGSDSSSSSLDPFSTGQMADMELKLRSSMQELNVLRKRLSERDLQVEELNRKLSRIDLRKRSSSSTPTMICDDCKTKDKVIADLHEKMVELEDSIDDLCEAREESMAIKASLQHGEKSKSASSSLQDAGGPPNLDLDVLLRNISDLNRLISENQQGVQCEDGRTAGFHRRSAMTITFYSNGFQLDDGLRFRRYEEAASKAFLKDLRDGFFPAELQGEHPDGVALLVNDRRDMRGPQHRVPFTGEGRRLQSRPGSSFDTVIPVLEKKPPRTLEPMTSRGHLAKKENNTAWGSSSDEGKMRKSSSKPLRFNKDGGGGRMKHKANQSSDPKKTTYSPFASKIKNSKSKSACHIKVLGLGSDTLLLELVDYDTVKTLRGVIRNHLLSTAASKSPKEIQFDMFSSFPRRKLDDDSLTLNDLSLAPNGVVHVNVD